MLLGFIEDDLDQRFLIIRKRPEALIILEELLDKSHNLRLVHLAVLTVLDHQDAVSLAVSIHILVGVMRDRGDLHALAIFQIRVPVIHRFKEFQGSQFHVSYFLSIPVKPVDTIIILPNIPKVNKMFHVKQSTQSEQFPEYDLILK